MKELVKHLVYADVPVLLWGAPGTGKTAAVTAMAAESGAHIEVVIGSILDPTDMGRPIVVNGRVKICPPPWAERLAEAVNNGQEAWLFLDELTCAPPSIQAAVLRIVQERKIADLDLSGVKILAAANPVDQAASGEDLSLATANRWAHLDWQLDADVWCAGELGGWGKPDKSLAHARAIITSWIGKNPTALLSPPPSHAEDIKGWPSPRSWSNLCSTIGFLGNEARQACMSKIGRQLASSIVGPAAATEFTAWLADVELPDADSLLSGTTTLPTRGDRSMLAMTMAISHALHHDRLSELWVLCRRQREDLQIQSAKRAMASAVAAGIDPPMTPELQDILTLLRKLNT